MAAALPWGSAVAVWMSGLLFAALHSLLASVRCKRWCYQRGLREPRYRLAYSILAMVSTLLWLRYVHSLPDAPLYRTEGALWWLLVGIQLIGGVVVAAAFRPIDGLAFLGLRRAASTLDPFVVGGIYRYLRHPMYAGAMLILFAFPEQSWNGLHVALVVTLYFVIGSRLEEARMVAAHPEYREYRMRVPAFVPTGRGWC